MTSAVTGINFVRDSVFLDSHRDHLILCRSTEGRILYKIILNEILSERTEDHKKLEMAIRPKRAIAKR